MNIIVIISWQYLSLYIELLSEVYNERQAWKLEDDL